MGPSLAVLAYEAGLHLFNAYGYSLDDPLVPEKNIASVSELGDRQVIITGEWNFEPGEMPIDVTHERREAGSRALGYFADAGDRVWLPLPDAANPGTNEHGPTRHWKTGCVGRLFTNGSLRLKVKRVHRLCSVP
eukprot:1535259-Amphidinium_carterae.1